MIANAVPLNTPVCLKAHTGNNLQNEFVWRNAKCNNRNTLAWEQMMILQLENGKFIIQSRWNGRNLQVQPDGKCVFANHNKLLWEQFDILAYKNGRFLFVSCHTKKLLQCDLNYSVKCVNSVSKIGDWEAWTVVFPNSSEMMTSDQLQWILIGGAILAAGVVVIGVISWALVPFAMSTFGVMTAAGTVHASFAAGGLAATLQVTASTFLAPTVIISAMAVTSVFAVAASQVD